MVSYPVRNGIAIPTCEVDLPETRLNWENPHHLNNHHLEFSKRMFSHTLLLQTLRDLEYMQEDLPMDIHNMGKNNLHTIYSPPKLPTPRQAMDRIGEAFEIGERLHVWKSQTKSYEYQPITHALYKSIKAEYWSLK